MSSSAVNVPNPVTNPTSVQLAQIASNIAETLKTNVQNGRTYEDIYDCVFDLCSAIDALAQSLLTINNSTASSVGTVNVSNRYNLGAAAAIPTLINTATL